MKNLKKIYYNSPVILTFTLICFISLILGYLTKFYSTKLFFAIYRSSPFNPFTYIRLFTHIFGHVNFQHFFNNFLIILIVGPMLEEKYGSINLIIMIFSASFIIGVIHIAFFDTILLGSSGICFMFIILSSFTNNCKGFIPLTFILVIIFYIGREVVFILSVSNENISRLTHIIGAGCGVFFAKVKIKKFY